MELKTASGTALEVAEQAFGKTFNEALVHQAVEKYLAGGRRGTKAQKTRAEVSGGGRKPWRQKGTGNARAGTIRSPIWVGGGTHFAAKPRDFSKGLNRKMYRGALRSILSELVREERLILVDDFGVAEPKTKAMAARLDELGGSDTLVVLGERDATAELAARNLPHAEVVASNGINPVNLLRHERVVVTVDAVKRLEGWLA
jgi:large subunit ribosomal protein L4